MKRIILLIVATLLLVGCSLDSIPQEGLTNAIGAQGGDRVIVATSVKCDVHPLIMDKSQARVSCQVEITEDASKLGFEKPTKVYLGGALGDEHVMEHDKPFSSSGTGVLELLYPDNNLGAIPMALTAQIDGFSSPVEIVGVGSTEGSKSLEIPANGKGESSSLELSACAGTLIPNSSLAQITFTGKSKDGQQIAGGGILDTNVMPLADMCNEVSAEGVVFEVETTFMKIGDIKGEFKLGIIRDSATGRPIIWGVVVNHEEQY